MVKVDRTPPVKNPGYANDICSSTTITPFVILFTNKKYLTLTQNQQRSANLSQKCSAEYAESPECRVGRESHSSTGPVWLSHEIFRPWIGRVLSLSKQEIDENERFLVLKTSNMLYHLIFTL